MKTERMTLLVTPEEKALINDRAARLGISASEFIRKAIELVDADDIVAMEELALLVPELNAMADRIAGNIADLARRSEAHDREMARLRSPEYREQVRRELGSDDGIDWDAVRSLFGFGDQQDRAA